MVATFLSIFRSEIFSDLRREALAVNEFFTPESIDYAVDALCSEFLDGAKLAAFCGDFCVDFCEAQQPPQLGLRVGVLCAGNLPLVGFADMFYALLCGCKVVLKPSRRDPLMRAFTALPDVTISEDLSGFEGCHAILAMGSDQTCATLRALYPATPILARGSMHSVAVLDGTESTAELQGLLEDIFVHGGMGCRSVSHLHVPAGYDFSALSAISKKALSAVLETSEKAILTTAPLSQPPQSWRDNVRYQRAVMTIQGLDFIDLGTLLLVPGEKTATPGIITYSHYSTPPAIDPSRTQFISRRGTFGTGQRPTLCDFPNSKNVITFLRSIPKT